MTYWITFTTTYKEQVSELDNMTGWQVTHQQETTRPNDTGQFVSGVVVSFQTHGGVSGTVFVPDALYNAEHVKQVIQAKVDKMTGVQNLKG